MLVTEPAFLERALAVRARGAHRAGDDRLRRGRRRDALSWDDLLAAAPDGADLRELAAAVSADDLLTIIYTSGTTGPPKGVELTHATSSRSCAATSAGLGLEPTGMRAISYLPMAHIAERLVTHYLPIAHGWRVTTCADARRSGRCCPTVRPEVFFSPPRMWEKLRAATIAELGERPDGADRARGARPRRRPRRDHRRGAVPGRGHRVLARARPAAVRGLRDVRDDRRRDGQPAGRGADRHRRRARCRASRWRCRMPARC